MGTIFLDLKQAIIDLNQLKVESLIEQVTRERMDFLQAIEWCAAGLKEVGAQFESGDIFLPELMKSGQIMKTVLSVLEPEMKKEGTRKQILGRVLVGTVEGDVHDIGKNIVDTMFVINGFEVTDLGKDVPASRFVEETKKIEPDIVATSAMLTTTMTAQRDLVDSFIEAGLRNQIKILVGGAPVTQDWAERIGADGYGGNAVEGVRTAKKLMGRE